MRRMGVIALVALFTFASCSTPPEPAVETRAGAGASQVTIEAIAFDPAELQVSVGDTVVWTNEDEAVKHTVTSGKAGDRGVPGLDNAKPDRPDGLFDGALTDVGDTFEFTFDDTGSFTYFCRVHPVMTARITVGD